MGMTTIPSGNALNTFDAAEKHNSLTRSDLCAILMLVVALAGMFWKVIFTPALFFYRDVYNYTYPCARFIHDLCRQGYLPYWNPYLNYGQPLLANPNLLFFYPFTLLIILLPADAAYTLHFLTHFALAGVGTYLLARTWRQSRPAALFAGLVFMLSGPMLSLGNFYNEVACAAWIPWALLATHHALTSGRARPWLLLAGVFSLQWLAGEPLTFLATFGMTLAYAFYTRGSHRNFRSPLNFRLVAAFGGVGALTLLLCSIQFLPAVDLLSHSRRGMGFAFMLAVDWSANPFSLLDMLIPDFAGTVFASAPGWAWLMADQNRNGLYLPSEFLGFVPFFFALAGWAVGKERQRNFVAGTAIAFLVLSFGQYTPVYALAYLLLPPVAFVRFPVKLLVHFAFLVAILAGWGFDRLRGANLPWKAPRARLLLPIQVTLACVATTAVLAWLTPGLIAFATRWVLDHFGNPASRIPEVPSFLVSALRLHFPGLAGFCAGAWALLLALENGKKWAPWGMVAFAILAVCELVMVNSAANPTVDKSFYQFRPPVLAEFKDAPGSYRFMSLHVLPNTSAAAAKGEQNFVNFDTIPEGRDLQDPVARGAFLSRLELTTGVMLDRVEAGLSGDIERQLPPFLRDMEFYLNLNKSNPARSCLLGRTNVKYLLESGTANSPATRKIGDVFNGSLTPLHLYENLCFVPRTYVAGNSKFLSGSEETLQLLGSQEFDASNAVILAVAPGSTPSVGGQDIAGQAEIVHRDPNSVDLRARLSRPGYIVLLERYEPNWHAELDGHPAAVIRANQLFRAVYASAGTHTLRFYYRQRGLKPGMVLSLATLAGCLLIYILDPRTAWLP